MCVISPILYNKCAYTRDCLAISLTLQPRARQSVDLSAGGCDVLSHPVIIAEELQADNESDALIFGEFRLYFVSHRMIFD